MSNAVFDMRLEATPISLRLRLVSVGMAYPLRVADLHAKPTV